MEDFIHSNHVVRLIQQIVDEPLTLRHWKQGDQFHPFGMEGKRQKISDYFTNQKLSLLEKEKVWLLCSGEDICWVVGYRIDERFKITDQTEKVFEMEWQWI